MGDIRLKLKVDPEVVQDWMLIVGNWRDGILLKHEAEKSFEIFFKRLIVVFDQDDRNMRVRME